MAFYANNEIGLYAKFQKQLRVYSYVVNDMNKCMVACKQNKRNSIF